MTDPFDDLREPITPVNPDPAFTRALRARLERPLALPKGVIPVTATTDPTTEPGAGPDSVVEPRPAAGPSRRRRRPGGDRLVR